MFWFSKSKFKKLNPGKAKHRDGFTVGISGRESVFYEDSEIAVSVGSDMLCDTIPLYIENVKIDKLSDGSSVLLSHEEIKLIIKKIEDGLKYLGIKYELVDNSKSTNLNNLNFSSMKRDPITGEWVKVDTDAKEK